MNKYSLEVEDWGEWALEKDFSSVERAKRYALDKFPQNQWRIFDRVVGSVVYTHTASSAIEEAARQEVSRFNRTDHWREVYAQRDQQFGRLSNVANRQREEQRRNRLRGFQFVGDEPAVLRRPRRMDPPISRGVFNPALRFGWERPSEAKVNWLKEGF